MTIYSLDCCTKSFLFSFERQYIIGHLKINMKQWIVRILNKIFFHKL